MEGFLVLISCRLGGRSLSQNNEDTVKNANRTMVNVLLRLKYGGLSIY